MPRRTYPESTHYRDGRFFNALPRSDPQLFPMLKRLLFENHPNALPSSPIPTMARTCAEFAQPEGAARVTWLGHSTLLLELDGQRLLIDPVWGDYASPGRFFGVKRFYPPPLPWSELPPIDAVILSHDHYDHLNRETIKAFAAMKVIPRFIVPLGVAARIEKWGIPTKRISEFDWWGETTVGAVRLVATPARHFSGRVPWDRDTTLWCGWAFLGATQRIYYAGDSAMFPGFQEIGDRLGPFDLTLIEIGSYDRAWPDVHMGPEQAVAAHGMVRGKVMLPVHWGLFKLAFHGWTEPIERALAAAASMGVTLVVPRPGESVLVDSPRAVERWWPKLPWRTAAQQPIVSTGVPREYSFPRISSL